MNNWGICKGRYDTVTGKISIQTIDVFQHKIKKNKQVRQNSTDLTITTFLAPKAYQACQGSKIVFVEMPVGSQVASGMKSYGICLGVLGALKSSGVNIIEVMPDELRNNLGLKPKDPKKATIDLIHNLYPDLAWPMQTKKGITSIVAGKAEHMADAIGAVKAGVKTNEFTNLLSLL